MEVIEKQNDELIACIKYALGLEGGGSVVVEGVEPGVGMVKEVFVELLEYLVPKWDPARKGLPLGEGYFEEDESDDEEEDDDAHDDEEGGY